MFPFAIFGIDSDGLNLAVNLLILCGYALVLIFLTSLVLRRSQVRG